jgi:hypothetical protein
MMKYTTMKLYPRTLKILKVMSSLTGEPMSRVVDRLVSTEFDRMQVEDELLDLLDYRAEEQAE